MHVVGACTESKGAGERTRENMIIIGEYGLRAIVHRTELSCTHLTVPQGLLERTAASCPVGIFPDRGTPYRILEKGKIK